MVTFPGSEKATPGEFGSEELDEMLSEVEELPRKGKPKKGGRQSDAAADVSKSGSRSPKSRGKSGSSSSSSMPVIAGIIGACVLIGGVVVGLMMFSGGSKPKLDAVTEKSLSAEAPPSIAAEASAKPAADTKSPGEETDSPGIKLSGVEVKLIPNTVPHAFDPESGRLIVQSLDQHSRQWHLYQPTYFDGNETAVRKIESAETVTAAGFKSWKGKSYLVVCTSPLRPQSGEGKPATLMLLDPVTLQPIPRESGLTPSIQLEAGAPVSVSASPAEESLVLVNTDTFSTLVDLRDGSKSRYPTSSRSNPQFSQSGRYVLTSHARILRTNRNLQTSMEEDLHTLGTGDRMAAVDPFDQIYVSTGVGLPLGIRQLTSTSQGSTPFPKDVEFRCFMQKLPWLVGSDATQIHWLSRETGQSVLFGKSPLAKLTQIIDDAGRSRLLLISAESAMAVPYDKIVFPTNDAMVATLELPERVAPGQKVSVPFVSPTAALKISLLNGPDSAQITDGRLEWTPTENEIGLVQFKVRYELGVDVKDDVIQAVVSRVPVPLPFEPREFQISPDGKHVVAWNTLPSVFGQPADPPRVAVYNLETKQVSGFTRWDHDILALAVSNEYVAVLSMGKWNEPHPINAGRDGSNLLLYRLPDLKLERTESLSAPASALKALGPNSLLIKRQLAKGGEPKSMPFIDANVVAMKLPEFTPQSWDRFLNSESTAAFDEPVRQAIDGRWIIGNMALDAEANRVEGFFNPGRWRVPRSRFGNPVHGLGMAINEVNRWTTVQGDPALAAPLKAAYGVWNVDNHHRELGATSVILFKDFVNPEFQTAKIGWSTKTDWGNNNPAKIALTKHGIVCVAEGLHVIPLATLGLDASNGATTNTRPVALQVRAAAGQFSIRSGGTVTFEVTGGKPPYKFEYKNDPGDLYGVEVNPVGRGEKVMIKYTKGYEPIAGEIAEFMLANAGAGNKKSAKDIVDSYQSTIYAGFAGIIDKSSSEIPFPREIGVTVTDASGTATALSHLVFLEIPEKNVLKHVQNRMKK